MYSNRYAAFNIPKPKSERKIAYEILSNKDNIKKRLYKTKMCNKTNCKDKFCNYAHSKEELRPLMCFFGDDCIYKDSKNKPCTMWHPSDDKKTKCEPCTKIFIKKIL